MMLWCFWRKSAFLRDKKLNKALFLDRDGVINLNHGYVHSVDSFDFIDGIFDLVRFAKGKGYLVIVVTNQAGIGRGYYSEEQFQQLTKWMCGVFDQEGAPIDRVYFSPYHPTAGLGIYRKDDETRKPRPGMLLRAKHDFGLSLEDSILVGDKPTDIQAGLSAGVGQNVLFSLEDYSELAGTKKYCSVHALKDVVNYL
jgi:D-glycero-D-manno-heptose 1,7-bisphosphate phosphatase